MSGMREHYVLIVAGGDQENRLNQFSNESHKERKLVYKKSEAKEILEKYKKTYEEFIHSCPPEELNDFINDQYRYLCETNPEDFYADITYNMELDSDGNAWIYENPEAKFKSWGVAGVFANPFILKTGEEAYSAVNSDIDWGKTHMMPEEVAYYDRVWEMCVNRKRPRNDIEKRAYKNMKNRKQYFLNFENKETYVASNTSFWAYAFLGTDNKWEWFEDSGRTQFQWMTEFYDRFIKDLPEDTQLTIYECVR